MASINWASIEKKIGSALKSSKSEEVASQKIQKYGEAYAKIAALNFKSVLQNEINSNPLIDVAGWKALRNISCGDVYVNKKDKNKYIFSADINFEGDMHRQSLAPEYYGNGIENIAALLNNGYSAAHIISGEWVGHMSDAGALGGSRKTIPSLQTRPGAQFIQNAVRAFESSDAATKNHVINIQINSIYE